VWSRNPARTSAFTHDGDADRALLCDESGELVDGDEILAIASVDLLRTKKLRDNTLVATVMSNFGLDEVLAAHGGKVIRTKVGDRYVLEEMMARDLNVGGEQSGHMIFRDFTTTGDGIISALQVLRIMKESGKPLRELKGCLEKVSAGPAEFAGETQAAAGGIAGRDEVGERNRAQPFREGARAFALLGNGTKNPVAY
jgi:phosphoglucosamine mutase